MHGVSGNILQRQLPNKGTTIARITWFQGFPEEEASQKHALSTSEEIISMDLQVPHVKPRISSAEFRPTKLMDPLIRP